MALNQKYNDGDQIDLAATAHIGAGVNPASGDPVMVGDLPGVALTDEDTVTGLTAVKTNGVYELAVTGHNGTAGAAIAAGDIVNFDAGADQINVNPAGVRYGYALAAVGSAATAIIPVKIGY